MLESEVKSGLVTIVLSSGRFEVAEFQGTVRKEAMTESTVSEH